MKFRYYTVATILLAILLGYGFDRLATAQHAHANLLGSPFSAPGPGITHVQSNQTQVGFGSSISTTGLSALGAGNTVVGAVIITDGSTTAVSISDGTNTYAIIDGFHSLIPLLYTFYKGNITGGPTSITATLSGSSPSSVCIVIDEYANTTATAVDGHNGQNQAAPGSGANAIVSGNITTTNPTNVIWGVVGHAGGGISNTSTGTGFTTRNSGLVPVMGPVMDCNTEDKLVSVTGTYQSTFTNVPDGGLNFSVAVIGVH